MFLFTKKIDFVDYYYYDRVKIKLKEERAKEKRRFFLNTQTTIK